MKILIVDDEITSRLKTDKLVSGLGHETLVAENGETAWEIWQHERPRVIITDWMMSEMTGVELCSRIRKAEGDQYTYIIIITSKDSPDDLETAMQYGVDDFIAKPFRKQELASRLRPAQRTIHLQTRDIVIFSMAKLAESRDPETGNHLERIRHYSRTLSINLKANQVFADELDESFIENIFQTSPLHDIGKVGIPDHVLLKPDRLDDSEFDTMKAHTIIGHKTLNDAFRPGAMNILSNRLIFSTKPTLNHGKKWRIGYYEGGEYYNYKGWFIATVAGLMELGWIENATIPRDEGEYTTAVWNWLATEMKNDYIEFVKDANYSAKWDKNLRAQMTEQIINRFNNQKDIDLMLAFGTWAGKDLANDRHSTPTLIISASDAVGTGIIKLYVTQQGGVNANTILRIVEIANKYKIPTFSMSGSQEVKAGLFMSISKSNYKHAGQYYASLIAKIFNGAKPRQLDQVFEGPPKVAINLKTAQFIGFDPPMLLLGATDEIYK
nr:ABC transporter substrate binding protein [uncultured Desulfobacter sp.]